MNPSAEMAAQDALADKSAAVQNARNKVTMLLDRLDRQKLSPEQLDYVDSVPAALEQICTAFAAEEPECARRAAEEVQAVRDSVSGTTAVGLILPPTLFISGIFIPPFPLSFALASVTGIVVLIVCYTALLGQTTRMQQVSARAWGPANAAINTIGWRSPVTGVNCGHLRNVEELFLATASDAARLMLMQERQLETQAAQFNEMQRQHIVLEEQLRSAQIHRTTVAFQAQRAVMHSSITPINRP